MSLPRGLIPAVFTPFDPAGQLDVARVPALVERAVGGGIEGVFVGGTTGEFASMTQSERLALISAWCRESPAELRVIAHVGGTSLGDSIELARSARDGGAAAIAAIAPYFFRPATSAELIDWCGRIAAAAPEIPFLFYHIPSLTQVAFAVSAWLEPALERIPNLAGIKYTHLDPDDLIRAMAIAPERVSFYYGSDETLMTGLALGVRGAVGSTYGFMAPLYQRMIAAFRAGDIATARELQLRAARLIDVFKRYRALPAMKSLMATAGADCGAVRPPLVPLDARESAALHAEIEPLGFAEACSG